MAAYYGGKAPLLSPLALLNWAAGSGSLSLSLLAEDGGGAVEGRKPPGRPRRDGEGSDISLPPFPLPLPRRFLGEWLPLEIDERRADGRALFSSAADHSRPRLESAGKASVLVPGGGID